MMEIKKSIFLPIKYRLTNEVDIAPLIVFRVLFGVMMFLATARFIKNGWVEQLYIKPSFFFSYYGFEWIKPIGEQGIYLVFGLLILSSIGITIGLFYRLTSVMFFVCFTYIELIDKTNYLNHYYFISLVALILCFLPAHRSFSLDTKLGFTTPLKRVPRYTIFALQLQLVIVYFFAGIAKINTDWLFHAMPLKIWLPTKSELPMIGSLLAMPWIAFLFSWCGMLFDVLITFFLFNKRTVYIAYAIVVLFHVITSILFPGIGMFPFVMIVCATVFLPNKIHRKLISFFSSKKTNNSLQPKDIKWLFSIPAILFFILFFTIQVLLPFRYALYPKNLFETEQGYRFSWRVMLMEKAGTCFFYVQDKNTHKRVEVDNHAFLTTQQEKQMSTQPDMILQFAHHLKKVYKKRWQSDTIEVHVESYVSINGKGSSLYIDPTINLGEIEDGFSHKNWILATR
jgi:hypothetical protein